MSKTLHLKRMQFNADLQIHRQIHCRRCFGQRPANVAPRDWAKLTIGFTQHGVQVWCGRCDSNVIHINFEGRKCPAIGYHNPGEQPQ